MSQKKENYTEPVTVYFKPSQIAKMQELADLEGSQLSPFVRKLTLKSLIEL